MAGLQYPEPGSPILRSYLLLSFYILGTLDRDYVGFQSSAKTDGIPFGVTNLSNGKRIQVDVNSEGGGQNLAGEIPVGPWFGKAVADDPSTAAFPDIIFEPTFMDDGNVIYNDVQEEAQLYTAVHGKWVKTGENSFEAVVIRANLATTETTELQSWIKIRFSGIIDRDNRDHQLSGSLRMISFAPMPILSIPMMLAGNLWVVGLIVHCAELAA